MNESTVKEAVEIYFKAREGSIAESTLINEKATFENYILRFWSELKIKEIDIRAMVIWRSWLTTHGLKNQTAGLATATKNKILSKFNVFLRFVRVNKDLIYSLPKFKNEMVVEKQMQLWDIDEYNQFSGAITDIQEKLIFDILYWTGMRIGELLALKWSDFQKERALYVCKSLSGATSNFIGTHRAKIKGVKTRNSIRELSLPESVIETIKTIRERLMNYKMYDEDDFLLAGKDLFLRGYVENLMKRYCRISEIKKIKINEIRHSHASYMIREGVDIMTISRRLGHSNLKITIDTYVHLLKQRGSDRLACLLSEQ